MRIVAKTSPLEIPLEDTDLQPSLELMSDEAPSIESSEKSATSNNDNGKDETRKGFERLLSFIKKEVKKKNSLAPERRLFCDQRSSLNKYKDQIKSQDQDNQKGMAFDIAA